MPLKNLNSQDQALLVKLTKYLISTIHNERIPNNDKNWFTLLEIISLVDNRFTPKDVERIICDISQSSSGITFESIANEFKIHQGPILQNRKWTLIIPINLQIPIKNIELEGLKFKVRSSKEILKKYKKITFVESNYWNDLISPKRIKLNTEKCILVKSKGFTLIDAYENIISKYNLLLGIVDFSILVGNRFRQTNTPMVSYHIPPKTIYGVHDISTSSWQEYLSFSPYIEVDTSLKHYPANFDKTFRLIYSNLAKKYDQDKSNTEVNSLLNSNLRLYRFGVTTVYGATSFMFFWQIIESICQPFDPNGNTNLIRKTLKFFLSKKKHVFVDGSFENILKRLASKRNKYVHSGSNNFTHDDVNLVKIIAETCIFWILENCNQIKSKSSLNLLYSNWNKSQKELNEIKNTIKLIEKMKQS